MIAAVTAVCGFVSHVPGFAVVDGESVSVNVGLC